MITQTQTESRQNCIGASDVPAILGVSPWKDAFSLWAEKTGKVPAPEVGDAAEWGNVLEPAIAACASKALNRPVVRSTGSFKHPDLPFVRVNPDYFVEVSRRGSPIVECKSTSIAEGWGEEGTDQIPDYVTVQVNMQMRCTDSAFAHVARLLHTFGHPDFRIYSMTFSRSLADYTDEAVGRFWDHNVAKDTPPDTTHLSLPALGRMRRAAKVVQVDPALMIEYDLARAAEKAAEAAKKAAASKLLAAMGDADQAEVPGWRAKYTKVSKQGVDLDAIRAAVPDLVARCTKDASHYMLTVKQIKEKK
jgi:putative phage-type endonuclease